MRPSILKEETPAAASCGSASMAARSAVDITRPGGPGTPSPPEPGAAPTRVMPYLRRQDWLQRPRLPLRPPTMLESRQSPE